MPEGVALARDLVGPAMESVIARLTPDVRAVAAYHLGFADAGGNPIRSGSGKALRLLRCCRLVLRARRRSGG